MKKIFAFFVVIAISAAAQAYSSSSNGDGGGFQFGWSVLRVDETTNNAGASATDSQINHVSTQAGYTLSNGFYFGANYDWGSKYYQNTGTPSPETRVSYGPTIGYFNMGWFIHGTYFVSSTNTLANGTYYSNGTGYQAEVGYHYSLAPNFYLGISIVYDSLTYTQTTIGSLTASQTNSQTDYYPALNIGVNF